MLAHLIYSPLQVVLLGEGAVGKSSLMLRYVENKFVREHVSTIQVLYALIDTLCYRLFVVLSFTLLPVLVTLLLYHTLLFQASFLTKRIQFDGNNVELNIWDTAGQEKYHALGPIYYRYDLRPRTSAHRRSDFQIGGTAMVGVDS